MNTSNTPILTILIVTISFLFGCNDQSGKLFELMPASVTGIEFQNRLNETAQLNIFTYLYFYNGGGVASGDLNNDGLPDLYFTSNLESNKLYLNQGGFRFKDITEEVKVEGMKGWTTGVTMADVNGDGRLDVYISQIGDYQSIRGKNQLYINLGNDENGTPQFEDQGERWGLDLVGFSTQAAFFDYDLDGDLDMYMLNHSVHSNGTFRNSAIRSEQHPLAGDKMLRNDGDKFVDVTSESGIYSSALGYGLGISIGDLDWDGYPDIYIGNDFHEDDYLYLNNGDGTFREVRGQALRHTSRFSMGNDIADINNDGLLDILSVDMLPEEPQMLKASAGEDAYDVYHLKLQYGYDHQFARNTLQLNLGNGYFSEIGLLGNIYASDWSWSALTADMDLDGYKDIYIANGIKRRTNDLDYINYISNEVIQHRLSEDLSDEDLRLVENMPVVKIPNYAFKNDSNLGFINVSEEWGLNQKSFSNGAIYVDLDNDGDLDIVSNNIDEPAFIYKNNAITPEIQKNNFLKIKFKGDGPNSYGIGTKVIIPLGNQKIVNELYATRGYQSSVCPEMIIGLGERDVIDSLIVIWPDHRFQLKTNVTVNTEIEVSQSESGEKYVFSKDETVFFENISDSLSVAYKHEENKYIEFNREALIPHMTSTEGPHVAVGDVNGDGKEDFFVGGAKRQQGALFLQTEDGFMNHHQAVFKADSLHEDTDATFVDVEGDGDQDLIVVSGGNEFQGNDNPLQPRLYLNDGLGNFEKDETAFEGIYTTSSVVRENDIDNDGDVDLFIGSRVVPWNYGFSPTSYLLINDGNGNFVDMTSQWSPELAAIGMVKDAQWVDLDNDNTSDLVVVGEWMPITIFLNKNGALKRHNDQGLEFSNGWWNTVELTDLDNDGDLDLLVGNLGLNSKLKASKDEPVSLYVKDFDSNGKVDQLIYHFINGNKSLFATKDELGKQLTEIKNRFVKYTDFAKTDVNDVFPKKMLKDAIQLEAYELRSGVFINNGNLRFQFEPFPIQAQFAPLNAICIVDVNSDGNKDIFAAGNFYETNIQRGRYDADYGTLLKNRGNGKFDWIPNNHSGLEIIGQVRDIQKINYKKQDIIVVARNNEPLEFLRIRKL